MQKKSDDEDICACVEVSNVPALKHISSEVELNWDSVQVCCFWLIIMYSFKTFFNSKFNTGVDVRIRH